MNLELVMPANTESERVILGAILNDNSAYDIVSSRLSVDSFSLDSHRRIFLCMGELFEAGMPIEYHSLEEQLKKRQELETIGGANYIMGLTGAHLKGTNIPWHCDNLVDKYLLRQMIHASNSTIAAASEGSDTGKRILDYLMETLLTLQTNGCKEYALQPKEFSDQVMQNMADMRQKQSRLIGFSLGLQGIDHKTTGIRKKELMVIGGRPGQGKTAWALQIAATNAASGIGVGLFELEMDKESVLQRLYCSHGNIEFNRIRVPFLMQETDIWALGQIKEEIDTWPLFIDDDANGETGMSLAELCSRMRLLKRQKGVRLFIVDYLQLISAPAKDPRERIMKIVRRLRRLAKSEDIAIIALSQMPRPAGANKNVKPTMHDLLESGEIEQAAHLIAIPWWPLDEAGNIADDKWIVIPKQRNGETWDEPVKFIGKYQRYDARSE